MTNLQRRLKKLEALHPPDPSGLVPHSQKWLEYWQRQVGRADGHGSSTHYQTLQAMVFLPQLAQLPKLLHRSVQQAQNRKEVILLRP